MGIVGCSAKPLELNNPDVEALGPSCVDGGVHACEAACEGGDGAGCLAASVAYGHGIDVAENEGRMMQLEKRACELGVALGCHYYGYNFTHADRDEPETVRQYYDKACELGRGVSCKVIANMALADVPDDSKRIDEALDYLGRACALDHGAACSVLGDVHRLGIVVPKNDEVARKHYQAGCDKGFELACRNLQQDERLWVSLPHKLLFARTHAPDPNIVMPGATRDFRAQVRVDYCLEGGRKPTELVIAESSGEPELDEAVRESMTRWHFSPGPFFPADANLCFRMTYGFGIRLPPV